MHYICYVDEAGCPGQLPSANCNVQPCIVISGLIVPQENVAELTREYLRLKRTFNPRYAANLRHDLQLILYEIKGSDLRTDIRKGNRNKRRRTFGWLDKTLDLLDRLDCKIVSRVYVKPPGGPFDGKKVYSASIQKICEAFQAFLEEKEGSGVIIADSRTPQQNQNVSQSVFTQKFKISGDRYEKLLEMPLFGHSENHAGLQIVDWLSSTLIFPIATNTYCRGHINSIHIHNKDALIKTRYSSRLRDLQFRYQIINGRNEFRYCGGITVNDGIGRKSSAHMFR
ncbi:DUF3800 domain-containing protein [Marinobacter sp. DUT-1]|uniref:DUF3800 domain-containing protein n=1 Tax=Marinobacter sp. DUT-1 TaxID=3412037 RepID=UPI003D16DFCD